MAKRIAFVMEQTLGSVTHYLNLRREESQARGLLPSWIPIEFEHGRLPWALTGSVKARRAIDAVVGGVDGLFVHTTTLALLSVGHFRRRPAILSTDGTPANKSDMREWYGLKPETGLAARAKRAAYERAFRAARGFVAWSEIAARSLVQDYGCRAEDVCVIPPGIDLESFRPGVRDNPLPRILFVGGDFQRKGGDLLLRAFRERLRGRAVLEVVTGSDVPAEEGVRVHRGVKANSPELRALYAECDLFTLPTRADCLPLVCLEAMAAGLPVVATPVGGIPDLVRDGETGRIVPVDDGAALGVALDLLVSDQSLRRRLGAAARASAEITLDARVTAKRLFEFVRSRV